MPTAIEATHRQANVVLDMDDIIDSHHENVSFKAAVGTKQGLRKSSL